MHSMKISCTKTIFKSLSKYRSFFGVTRFWITIIVMEGCDKIVPTSYRCICMKKLGTFITKFNPFNSTSLLPVNSLLPEKTKQFVFKNMFEIPFLKSKISVKF